MATVPSKNTKTPREECYHAIRNRFASAVAVYLKQHPELVKDATREVELQNNLKALMALMTDLLKLLDSYEISARSRRSRKGDK